MSAMTNFTVRSLKANRVRTIVTVAGVALAAALLTAIFTSYGSLTDFLYRAEAATSGSWMSSVCADQDETSEQSLDAAKNDPNVTAIATFSDKGFAELSAEQQDVLGHYLTITAAEGDLESLCAVRADEGRLPENDHELLLFRSWRSQQGLQVGDTITLNVGQRQAVAVEEGASDTLDSVEYYNGQEVISSLSVQDGMQLDSSIGYFDAEQDGGAFNEKLVDVHQETYTVVGFYDRSAYALSTGVGPMGLTRGDPEDGDFTRTYLAFDAVDSVDNVETRTEALFPAASSITLHTALLRYMGISSDTGIWQTFFALVAILVCVIALACISLIFNAFNISVAERMNGFALLSSAGATPGQLRRSVLLEGLIIALIGIPLGLLIGLAGCAVTFAALGPAISNIAVGGLVPFDLKIDVRVLAAAALLTFITVLVSAWIPSKRASRANIIDALRQRSVSRISKRGDREAKKTVGASALWHKRGLSGRVFGIGGTLARINRKRSSSKGRAAAASLAIAIVLLMTAGSLNVFLGSLVDVASGGGEKAGEVCVSAQLRPDSFSIPKEDTDPQELLRERNAAFAEQVSEFEKFYTSLSDADDADPVGWLLNSSTTITLPDEMAGPAFEQGDMMVRGSLPSGTSATSAVITYLDDDSFDRYASEIGQDPALYHDAARPRAIALAQTYGNDGDRYQLIDALRQPGMIEVVGAATIGGKAVADLGFIETINESTGETITTVEPYVLGQHDGLEEFDDTSEMELALVPLEVAALSDHAPFNSSAADGSILLIVPASIAEDTGLGSSLVQFYSYFDSKDGDHAALAEQLDAVGHTFFDEEATYPDAYVSYNDFIEERDSTQMLATIVNVFCLLFTVILALIAMANVFNTVTNSLILRRREFAVMRSIGLSPKQFRRMIVDECVHFGIAGLIPGLIVSVGVSALLYLAVTQSLSGLPFTFSWSYLLLAILMTALIMALSVAYGLHRCKSNSVVEALRSDNI